MSNSVQPQRWQPTTLPCPWDSPGKNTAGGCHSLLQCMKVKSEREVAQSCPTLSNLMDCSPPGSSVHEVFQARVLEWGAIAFSGMLVQSCATLCNSVAPLSVKFSQAGVPERAATSFSRACSRFRGRTHIPHVSCISRQVLHH